jgi:hypothetical protein
MSASTQFAEALQNWPTTKRHTHMLRIANLAALAGIPMSEAEQAILDTMPRPPKPATEIPDTLRKAYAEAGTHTDPAPGLTPEQRKRLRERREQERKAQEEHGQRMAVEAVRKLAGPPIPLVDLMRMSPAIEPGADFDDEATQRQNASLLLNVLFAPSELVFTGDTYDTGRACLDTPTALSERFLNGADVPPFYILNPLTGTEGRTKGGKPSFRADECISSLRYALYECDLPEVSLEMQAAFLAGRIRAGWPIASIVFSGGKSLHALLRVDCRDASHWQSEIRESLFPKLAALGADAACVNPSRLSRLPGHRRDNGNMQSLIFLDPRYGAHNFRATACGITDTTAEISANPEDIS